MSHSFIHSVVFIRIVILLVIVLVMVVSVFLAGALYNANKLLFGVPWLTWLTLDEIVEMSHSRFWTKTLLPLFYRMNYLEIRISDNLSEFDRVWAEQYGFQTSTVAFYEFKFTEKWKRGKKKPIRRVPTFQPMFI